jgi:hypothetical protein
VSDGGVPEVLDLLVNVGEVVRYVDVVRQASSDVGMQDGTTVGDNREPNQVGPGIREGRTWVVFL